MSIFSKCFLFFNLLQEFVTSMSLLKFIIFQEISNLFLRHFYDGCFKDLLDHSITWFFSVVSYFSFLIPCDFFLSSGTTGDLFIFFPSWIVYLLGDFESYLSLPFSSQLPCLGLACGPRLFLWGFNDNSVFRDFTVIFVSAWYLWYHWGSHYLDSCLRKQ